MTYPNIANSRFSAFHVYNVRTHQQHIQDPNYFQTISPVNYEHDDSSFFPSYSFTPIIPSPLQGQFDNVSFDSEISRETYFSLHSEVKSLTKDTASENSVVSRRTGSGRSQKSVHFNESSVGSTCNCSNNCDTTFIEIPSDIEMAQIAEERPQHLSLDSNRSSSTGTNDSPVNAMTNLALKNEAIPHPFMECYDRSHPISSEVIKVSNDDALSTPSSIIFNNCDNTVIELSLDSNRSSSIGTNDSPVNTVTNLALESEAIPHPFTECYDRSHPISSEAIKVSNDDALSTPSSIIFNNCDNTVIEEMAQIAEERPQHLSLNSNQSPSTGRKDSPVNAVTNLALKSEAISHHFMECYDRSHPISLEAINVTNYEVLSTPTITFNNGDTTVIEIPNDVEMAQIAEERPQHLSLNSNRSSSTGTNDFPVNDVTNLALKSEAIPQHFSECYGRSHPISSEAIKVPNDDVLSTPTITFNNCDTTVIENSSDVEMAQIAEERPQHLSLESNRSSFTGTNDSPVNTVTNLALKNEAIPHQFSKCYGRLHPVSIEAIKVPNYDVLSTSTNVQSFSGDPATYIANVDDFSDQAVTKLTPPPKCPLFSYPMPDRQLNCATPKPLLSGWTSTTVDIGSGIFQSSPSIDNRQVVEQDHKLTSQESKKNLDPLSRFGALLQNAVN